MKRIGRALASSDPPWLIRAVRAGTVGLFACGLLLLGYVWIARTLEHAVWRERDGPGRLVLVAAVASGLLLFPLLAGALLAAVQQMHWAIGARLLPITLLPTVAYFAGRNIAAEDTQGMRTLELILLVTIIMFQSWLALQVVAWDAAPIRQIAAVLLVATLLCVLTATASLGLLPAFLAWALLPAVSHALAAAPPPQHTITSTGR